MEKKKKIKDKQENKKQPAKPLAKSKPINLQGNNMPSLPLIFIVLGVTAIAYASVFQNELTNWDDEYYVVQNALLRGPDWQGIFTQPVVSNYHPLTIITLAFNYAISQLDATSYLVVNLVLHLLNTYIVYLFIFRISRRKIWAAAITALIFGVHPMHVESVAWVSERKDVLYTFFLLLSLLQYWKFLEYKNNRSLYLCLLFFILSILSKPAAIILPLLLLLLDYWHGRSFSKKIILEKIPFLLISILFAIITVKLQSRTAISGLDLFPLWTRFFFATYVNMIYIVRFFVPYPMSAFHPYPSPRDLGLAVQLSPLFMLALLSLVWYLRKNKLVVFCFFFFVINLVLVMQVVSIGGTLVAERYTYVPYIGIAFLIGMLIEKIADQGKIKKVAIAVMTVSGIAFSIITFNRVKVWKDSDTLWTDVIKNYPTSPVPLTNRANYLLKLAPGVSDPEKKNLMITRALADCNAALLAKPDHAKGYENRQNIYLRLNRDSLAFKDAVSLLRIEPANRMGYYTKGVTFLRFGQMDSSLSNFNKCLEINPNTDFALNNRGSLLFNHFGRYDEAIADFTKAIQLNPRQADYFQNRSFCFYKKGDMVNAKADALKASELGLKLRDDYKQLLNIQ
jgi:protein O-mannosyl-transferase